MYIFSLCPRVKVLLKVVWIPPPKFLSWEVLIFKKKIATYNQDAFTLISYNSLEKDNKKGICWFD